MSQSTARHRATGSQNNNVGGQVMAEIQKVSLGIGLGILLGIPMAYAAPPPDTLPGRVAELEAAAVAVQAELDSINRH